MQIPALPGLCFHQVSSLKPAVQGLMWHFYQYTAILQASQQCKNTFCGSSSCWRHILQATQFLYAPNGVLLALLPTFSEGDQIHTHRLWCPRTTLMKALRQSINFPSLHTHTEHKCNLLPIPTHCMARTHTCSHQHTAAVLGSLLNGHGGTDISHCVKMQQFRLRGS